MFSSGPGQPTGYDFESEVKLLYLDYYDGKAEAVNGTSGDWGCDLIVRSEAMIVQIYGPETGPYSRFSFDERVCKKIDSEARKIGRSLKKLTRLLGTAPLSWRLVIPRDPSPKVISHAVEKFSVLGLTPEVHGESHLTVLKRQSGFDIHEHRWRMVAEAMRALPDEAIYGSADTLRLLYVSPLVTAEFDPIRPATAVDDSGFDLFSFTREAAKQWRSKFPEQKAPLVMFGDYGSGKSSLLKMLAASVASEKHTPIPIFVPLKEAVLRSHQSLRESLVSYVETHLGARLANEDWLERPKIWILDGFDELSIRFQEEHNLLVRLMEDIGQLALIRSNLVILSSRRMLFLKGQGQLPKHSRIFRVEGFGPKQVESWIDRWRALPHHAGTILSVEQLELRQLRSEAGNPLVLYMLARLIDHELAEQRPYLRAEIFRAFVQSTSGGRFEPSAADAVVPGKGEFEEILREIARIIFLHGNNDLVSLEVLRKEFRGEDMERAVALLGTRPHLLLVGHFFRSRLVNDPKHGTADDHIEFCHLSFREFLVADGLLRLLLSGDECTLPIAALLEFAFRPLGDAELGFLEELICLESWANRERLFRSLRHLVLTETGLEELVAKAVPPAAMSEFVAHLPLRKRTVRSLAYFVRATIAARASAGAFDHLIRREAHHSFITELMTYDAGWHDIIDQSRFMTRVFRRVPGGLLSTSAGTGSVKWEFDKMQEWAIMSGGCRSILNLEGQSWVRGFVGASEKFRLGWDVRATTRSIFCGVTLLLDHDIGSFTDCVFVDCLLNLLPVDSLRDKRTFRRCTFIDSRFAGADAALLATQEFDNDCVSSDDRLVPARVKRCPEIRERVIEARQRLTLVAGAKPGPVYRPWGEFIVPKDPGFEATVFRLDPEKESSIGFARDESWRVSRATEPASFAAAIESGS